MGLTTVAAVKSFLSIESMADDVLIASIIGAESELIEAYIDRSVAVTSYSDIFGGGGNCEHRFRQSPVQAITRVMVDGMEIAEAGEITERGYLLDDGRLLLFGYCFAWGRNNCRIDYKRGKGGRYSLLAQGGKGDAIHFLHMPQAKGALCS